MSRKGLLESDASLGQTALGEAGQRLPPGGGSFRKLGVHLRVPLKGYYKSTIRVPLKGSIRV